MQPFKYSVDIDQHAIYFVLPKSCDTFKVSYDSALEITESLKQAAEKIRPLVGPGSMMPTKDELANIKITADATGLVIFRFPHTNKLRFEAFISFLQFIAVVRRTAEDAKMAVERGLLLERNDKGLIAKSHDLTARETKIIRP